MENWYKISKVNKKAQAQTDVQEVLQAVNTIAVSVANINKSIETLEQTGVNDLFQKENLVNAIQSGDATNLDINVINTALNAMSQISQTILSINNALNIIQSNPEVSRIVNIDYNSVVSNVVDAIQSGNYQQFANMIGSYQANLKQSVGTEQGGTY